jgi:cytochrome c553
MRLLRWIGIALGSLVALALTAYLVVYVLSERLLGRVYQVPTVSISIPTDPGSIAEGRRLATVRGCVGSCHGPQAEGMILFEDPLVGRIFAPNLTAAVRKYSDAEIAVAIRNGLRPDGRSMIVMPAEAFVGLTDEDLGRIIAFLKSLPETPGPDSSLSLGPLGRLGFVIGKFKSVAELIDQTVPPPEAMNAEAAYGRYLARTICAGCHGTSLNGDSNPDFTSPPLQAVAAYSLQEFAELLRTGVALGGRNLGVMSAESRNNLSLLTDTEIAALYRYLHALPATAHN